MPNRNHNKQVVPTQKHPMSDMGRGSMRKDSNPDCKQVECQPIKMPSMGKGNGMQSKQGMCDKIY